MQKLGTHLNSEISQIKMRPFLCGMTILSLEEFILKQIHKKNPAKVPSLHQTNQVNQPYCAIMLAVMRLRMLSRVFRMQR